MSSYSASVATYSNLENHPRLIRARDAKGVPKIKLDPRTGLPTLVNLVDPRKKLEPLSEDDEDDRGVTFPSVEVDPADVRSAVKVTITRPREESKEEKRARKSAVKEERRNRRVEKKATKSEFTTELKKQQEGAAQKDKSRMKKL